MKDDDDGMNAPRGIVVGLLLGIALWLIFMLLVLTGCSYTLSHDERQMIEGRIEVMEALSGGTIPPVDIRWNHDRRWHLAGEADCRDFSITLNWHTAARWPAFMANTIIPHEYAHLLSCYYRGNMGPDPHDAWWRNAVIRLGGDPDYV